jgi:hypothetical protein
VIGIRPVSPFVGIEQGRLDSPANQGDVPLHDHIETRGHLVARGDQQGIGMRSDAKAKLARL